MDFIVTLLLSLVAGIVAMAVALFVFGYLFSYLFRSGDGGIAITEIGALVVGTIVLIVSFKKLWS